MQGEQPQAWESERWLAAIWSAQLDDGWVRMPPLAEDKLEAAHMNHAAQVTLEVSCLSLIPIIPPLKSKHVCTFLGGRIWRAPVCG